MNKTRSPAVKIAKLPTLIAPLFVKMLHSLGSFSFGSGLCNQSSFSTSSGNNKRPADGNILYFSETVCVLTCSSSLPARDGALESAKGSPPYILLSRPLPSELKLVLLDSVSTGDPGTDSSSLNLCILDRVGGINRVSAESIGPPLYILFKAGFFVGAPLCCGSRDLDDDGRSGPACRLEFASPCRRLCCELLRRT